MRSAPGRSPKTVKRSLMPSSLGEKAVGTNTRRSSITTRRNESVATQPAGEVAVRPTVTLRAGVRVRPAQPVVQSVRSGGVKE